MKRQYFLFLLFFVVLAIIPAEEKGLNLIPVPPRLLKSLPPAIISGADNGLELPVSVDIGSKVLGPVRSQGGLGACASWAVANEITRVERIRNNWPVGLNRTTFSPLYLYNQVNGGFDKGSSLYNNLSILVNQGCSTWALFPYVEDYKIQPSASARKQAANFKIAEFKSIPVDLDTMKLALAKGFGLIVSFNVFDNFDSYSGGIYKPRGSSGVERRGERFLHHGMTIVGYDDDDVKRNFLVLNSWGPSWGEQGYLRFSYDDLHTLISECYIMIPKDSLPMEALPPSKVQAGKGSNRNKVIITWEKNSADEYEVFKLCENETYISIGKTKQNYFEDPNIIPEQHYFYFVSSHKGEYMSEFSIVSEGWASNEKVVRPPGIPLGFTVNLQGDSILARWQAVENADKYQVFIFNNALSEYVLVGETTGTVIQMPLSDIIDSPVLTFIVLALNMNGQGLPSEPAALTIEGWKKPNDDEEREERNYEEVYKGAFYDFPLQRFRDVEKKAMEHFKEQRNRATDHFRNQRNIFMNRLQNINESFQGGKK
jgi:hypothetical protein